MKEEIMQEIRRVGTILVFAMFAFYILTIIGLSIRIDKLETKIEQLK